MRTPDKYWERKYRRADVPNAAFRAGLYAYFGIHTSKAGKFMCPVFLLMGKVVLDIAELDRWLMSRGTGYDESTDRSLRGEIEREFGPEAVAFVLRFITPQ
jgi:hypothetical protein